MFIYRHTHEFIDKYYCVILYFVCLLSVCLFNCVCFLSTIIWWINYYLHDRYTTVDWCTSAWCRQCGVRGADSGISGHRWFSLFRQVLASRGRVCNESTTTWWPVHSSLPHGHAGLVRSHFLRFSFHFSLSTILVVQIEQSIQLCVGEGGLTTASPGGG